jgi:CheY-like chemotaxis protein
LGHLADLGGIDLGAELAEDVIAEIGLFPGVGVLVVGATHLDELIDDALHHVHHPFLLVHAFQQAAPHAIDGLALLAQIKGLKPKTAVVIVTAYGTVSRAVEAMKLGAVDIIEKPYEPKAILLLCEEILQRQKIAGGGSVDDLLHLAELAHQRGARLEERAYLKTAMVRDIVRPEPYFQLGQRAEDDGDVRQAVQYYFMAHDADRTFHPAEDALKRLGKLKPT